MNDTTVITLLNGAICIGSTTLAPPELDPKLFDPANEAKLFAFAEALRKGIPRSEVRDLRASPDPKTRLFWCHRHVAMFTTGRPEAMWGDSWSKTCDEPGLPYEWRPGQGEPHTHYSILRLRFTGGLCAWDQTYGPVDEWGNNEVLPRVTFQSINRLESPSRPWLKIGSHDIWRGCSIVDFVMQLHEHGGTVNWDDFLECAWAFPFSFLRAFLRGLQDAGPMTWRERMIVAPLGSDRRKIIDGIKSLLERTGENEPVDGVGSRPKHD